MSFTRSITRPLPNRKRDMGIFSYSSRRENPRAQQFSCRLPPSLWALCLHRRDGPDGTELRKWLILPTFSP